MSETNQTIFLTGAAGFIGSHVAEALLRRGDRVIGYDNFDPFYDEASKRRNLEEVRATAAGVKAQHPGSGFEFVQGDICDAEALRAAFRAHRPTGVIHLAAKAGVRPSLADPMGYMRTNVLGTTAVLEAAREAMPGGGGGGGGGKGDGRCTRIAMASSSSVYGNNTIVPFSEEHDVSGPISPYAASKRACELIAHTHAHLTGMPTACLRFFTVYGPRQRPDLAIRLFLRLAAKGDPIQMYGTGDSSRDYTFVEDIVRGAIAAYDRIPEHGYRIWNIGGSQPMSLSDMIGIIGDAVGRKVNVEHRPARPGDVQRTYADVRRSAAELGYKARTPFAEGVKRQYEWMQRVGDV